MYCTACGSYSSDAGGHVCAEPEVPVRSTATATVAPDSTARPGPGGTPPAGWHPDPNDPALVRYWDGSSWTEHTSWATGVSTIGAGTAAGTGGFAAPHDATHGRFLGALPRTVGRGGRVDVLVYERSLVFARVPGIDPALLGFLVGLPVSGVVGYIAGDYIGANGDGARVAELTRLSPDQIAAKHKRNAVVPISSLSGGRVLNYGRSGGRMKLRTAGGKKWKRRWTRPHLQNVDAHLLLSPVLHGTRVTVKRGSPLRPFVPYAVLVGLLVLLMFSAMFLGTNPREREEGAIREVAPSCKAVLDLNERAGQGQQIDPQELVTTVDNLVEPMRSASSRADAFDPAFEAVYRIDAYLGAWDRSSELPESVLTDLGVVINTCSAATAAA